MTVTAIHIAWELNLVSNFIGNSHNLEVPIHHIVEFEIEKLAGSLTGLKFCRQLDGVELCRQLDGVELSRQLQSKSNTN